MTARQRLVPLGIILAFASGVTYFLVKPAFDNTREERQARAKRRREIWKTRYETPDASSTSGGDHTATAPPSPDEILRRTEENVANAGGATRISKDAPRWGQVQEGQFAEFAGSFKWRDVPLDRFSEQGGGGGAGAGGAKVGKKT